MELMGLHDACVKTHASSPLYHYKAPVNHPSKDYLCKKRIARTISTQSGTSVRWHHEMRIISSASLGLSPMANGTWLWVYSWEVQAEPLEMAIQGLSWTMRASASTRGKRRQAVV